MNSETDPLLQAASTQCALDATGVADAPAAQPLTYTRPAGSYSRPWHLVLLAVVIVLFGLVRYRLRSFPLERDEGEYAYAAQLLLHGVSPYRYAYTMKLPGTAAMYAAILGLFGQTAAGVHLGLLVVNALTTVLVYLLGARTFGRLAGLVAAASFAVLSVSPSVLGMAAHATHFVLLAALAGLLLLLSAIDRAKLWMFACSGVLLGAGFLMKQPGILFCFFAVFWILCRQFLERHRDWRRAAAQCAALLSGAAVPFAVTCLLIAKGGSFHPFWFWTFSYMREYGTELSMREGAAIFREVFPSVVGPGVWIWALAGLGLVAMMLHKAAREHALFLGGLVLFSCLAVCPGFYFREHYFILMLPALAVLAGVAVTSATRALSSNSVLQALPVLAFVLAFGYAVHQQRAFFFTQDPVTACRDIYGGNPFPEAPKIAEYIKAHTSPGETIAVVGSEPEIYFYSGRRSATGYIYTYGLMEAQPYALSMQKEMAAQIERSRPAYLVAVRVPTSWLRQPSSHNWIFNWSNQYIHNYELVGVAEIGPQTSYIWGDEAKTHVAQSPYLVLTFRRNGG